MESLGDVTGVELKDTGRMSVHKAKASRTHLVPMLSSTKVVTVDKGKGKVAL